MFSSKFEYGYQDLSIAMGREAVVKLMSEPAIFLIAIETENPNGSFSSSYLGKTVIPTDEEEVSAYNSLRSQTVGGMAIPSHPFSATLGFVDQVAADEVYDAYPGATMLAVTGIDLITWSDEAKIPIMVYWPDWTFCLYNVHTATPSHSVGFESEEILFDLTETLEGLRDTN